MSLTCYDRVELHDADDALDAVAGGVHEDHEDEDAGHEHVLAVPPGLGRQQEGLLLDRPGGGEIGVRGHDTRK